MTRLLVDLYRSAVQVDGLDFALSVDSRKVRGLEGLSFVGAVCVMPSGKPATLRCQWTARVAACGLVVQVLMA